MNVFKQNTIFLRNTEAISNTFNYIQYKSYICLGKKSHFQKLQMEMI